MYIHVDANFYSILLHVLFSQTQKLVEHGDIEAARSEFRVSFCCRLIAWTWSTVFVSIAVSLILVLGVVYGVGNRN